MQIQGNRIRFYYALYVNVTEELKGQIKVSWRKEKPYCLVRNREDTVEKICSTWQLSYSIDHLQNVRQEL